MKSFARNSLCLLLLLGSSVAFADELERKNPLEGQPAIRHRYELRKGRFEIGPSFGITLNRAFLNTFMVGGKAEYHINDYLSFGADFGAGINFPTSLLGELEDTFKEADGDNTPQEFQRRKDRLSRIKMAGDVRAVFTPMSGKLGIFSAIFLSYDFYFFAGVSLAMTGNSTDEQEIDDTNEGFRVGFAWGAGIHVFANKFVSIGVEIKDLMFANNESGGDITRGLKDDEKASCQAGQACKLTNKDDKSFISHFLFGLNVTFFLPTKPDITP